jgi:hypothetical protein
VGVMLITIFRTWACFYGNRSCFLYVTYVLLTISYIILLFLKTLKCKLLMFSVKFEEPLTFCTL